MSVEHEGDRLRTLDVEAFADELNTAFRAVDVADAGVDRAPVVELELVSCSALDGGDIEQFSVVFAGPGDVPLGQGTYSLTHERMGELALFLVPIAAEGDRTLYEAAFSRLRSRHEEG